MNAKILQKHLLFFIFFGALRAVMRFFPGAKLYLELSRCCHWEIALGVHGIFRPRVLMMSNAYNNFGTFYQHSNGLISKLGDFRKFVWKYSFPALSISEVRVSLCLADNVCHISSSLDLETAVHCSV